VAEDFIRILNNIKNTPVPVLLIILGAIFIIPAVSDKSAKKFGIPSHRQVSTGTIGGLILFSGLLVYILPIILTNFPSAQRQNQEQLIDISGIWIGTLTTSGNDYHYELQILQQGNSEQGKSIAWKKADPIDKVEAIVNGTLSDKVLRYDEVEISIPSPRNTQCLVSGELKYLISGGTETLTGNLVQRADPNRCPDLGFVTLQKQK